MVTERRKTQIYIVDDSLTIRAMMDMLIGRDEEIEICGMAADAETALEEIEQLMPDVVLLDLAFPGMDGLAFLDAIRGHWRAMQVIIVSSSAKHGAAACDLAFNRGAIACFDKSKLMTEWREFLELIEEAGAGHGLLTIHDDDAVTLPGPHR